MEERIGPEGVLVGRETGGGHRQNLVFAGAHCGVHRRKRAVGSLHEFTDIVQESSK
jgi:hypothetical protein